MIEKLEEEGFDDRLVFSDEATFHVNCKVNKYNTRIWVIQNPPKILEHQRDSTKETVFCAISKKVVYVSFFFERATFNVDAYLDILGHFEGF